ncbi:superinfection immunity protein [Klebsiella pneumoniae]|uniref:superinfection immunity protein n=1 Tax=Klebsiella pneumoniae TaxID=573 RepID=UPI00321AED94
MSVWHIIVLIFAMIIYVLPGVIASSREHKNATAIWVLNIVLGWSFLGWIAALVWSFTNPGVVKLEPALLMEWSPPISCATVGR